MDVIRKGERWKKTLSAFSDVIADCLVRVGSKRRRERLARSTVIDGGIVEHRHTTSLFYFIIFFVPAR